MKKNGWSLRVHSSCNTARTGTAFSILIPVFNELKLSDSAPSNVLTGTVISHSAA